MAHVQRNNSLKKEEHSAIWNSMDKPWGYYAKWKKPDRRTQTLCWAIWVNTLIVAKIVEAEGRVNAEV